MRLTAAFQRWRERSRAWRIKQLTANQARQAPPGNEPPPTHFGAGGVGPPGF